MDLVSNKKVTKKYDLFGVIYHRGDVSSGHFFSRMMLEGSAWEYDDLERNGYFRQILTSDPLFPTFIDHETIPKFAVYTVVVE
jgi:ubiquitin C-terminal hydrolase